MHIKKSITIITLILLLTMCTSRAFAITSSKSVTIGGIQYITSTTTLPVKVSPVQGTQVLHTQGYITTLSVSSAVTTTLTASSSLTVGATYFVQMAMEIGIAYSESCTLQTSVSFTIPQEIPNGFYRISAFFANSYVVYDAWNTEPRRIQHYTISYAPDRFGSYYALDHYA